MRTAVAVALLLAVVLFSTACEDGVDPFVESTRYFTVFGYLDTALDTQFVRVIPLRQSLDTDADVLPIDAVVTLTELQTGYQYTLRDSVVRFENGRYGHVFFTPLRPAPGRTYRLEVTRGDGETTRAETTVPLFKDAEVGPAQPFGTGYTQTVVWEGIAFQPFAVEVWYRFATTPPGRFLDYVVLYPPGSIENGQLQVPVRLSDDYTKMVKDLNLQQLSLMGIGMRLTDPDEAWRPPGGVFDREVLSQPGTFSNVENGDGFFGAANRYTVEWTLTDQVTQSIGFLAPD